MMKTKGYDLAVAYRIYPRVSKPTPVFAADKYRLAELCLRSFKESLGDVRVKVWALLDGCPPEYTELFRRFFHEEDLVLVELPGIGNLGTFERQVDILLQQTDADLVYFAEDDYYYVPGEFGTMLDFMRENPDVDFVTAYDHPDYYELDLHQQEYEIRMFGNRHWRTAGSTCLTFLTRRSTLARTARAFRAYSHAPCSDAGLWFSLTKLGVYRPARLVRALFSDRVQIRILSQAWRYCTRELITGRRWKLWVPVPSIATHMETAYLAPGIDWRGALSEVIARQGGGEMLVSES